MLLTLGWQASVCVGGWTPSWKLFINSLLCPPPCVCVLLLLVSRSESMPSCLAVQWLNACLSIWPHCFIATHAFLWKNWGGQCKWNHKSCPCLPFHFLFSVLCPLWHVFFSSGRFSCFSSYAVQVWECAKVEHCERTLLKSLSCSGPSALCTEGNFCGLGNCS